VGDGDMRLAGAGVDGEVIGQQPRADLIGAEEVQ
jgi:hypothetical protein